MTDLGNRTSLETNVPTDCLIGGAWRPASDGGSFDVEDPATGDVIASVASATVDDGIAAVAAAHDALPFTPNTAPFTVPWLPLILACLPLQRVLV